MSTKSSLWETGQDETVEVNQRALIDKVLARYSARFVVFRELLQNSDDAQSSTVEIHFRTQNYSAATSTDNHSNDLPDLKTTLVHTWMLRNNGIIFREEDWQRLKKIADGNPDPERVGAFGVGFYSLFNVTEEPFVTSGEQWMGFYWKDNKDQLFVRRGHLPEKESWTSFSMPLREAAPMPVAFDLARFLASSITFMSCLSQVELFFDDKRLLKITKARGLPKELGVPKGLQPQSPSGRMRVTTIRSVPLRITVEVMAWVYTSGSEKPPPPSSMQKTWKQPATNFISSLFASFGSSTPQRVATPLPPPEPVSATDLLKITESSVTLSIFSAEVDVRLDKKIAAELLRSTKKETPRKLRYELIYTAKDEYDASKKEDEALPGNVGSIFQALRADLEGAGAARVFIGHATTQTTGVGGHMSARFITTVEREAIDFMDRNVSIWNKELLHVGGLLARAVYEFDLDNIATLWKGASSALSGPQEETRTWLQKRSIHALKFFTFYQSTPLPEVSSVIETTFFSCFNNRFPLISTVGVRNASEVRIPDPAFRFLKQLPVLPDEVLSEANAMIGSLQNRQLIKPIMFEDVLKELRSRPLTETEMVDCLTWWCGLYKEGGSERLLPVRNQLLAAAILTIGQSGSADERIVSLQSIRTFINLRGMGAYIPLKGPLPDHLLPVDISKHFQPEELSVSLPWTELSILTWLQHISDPGVCSSNADYDLNISAPWAEQVLNVLSRSWPSLSNETKELIQALLKTKSCIPTSAGMKIPEESYFAKANVFHDLPVVTLPSGTVVKSAMERLLQALGVRSRVDLQIVFNRMIKTNEWTVAELVKYLVSVQSTLTPAEWQRLQVTPFFFKERDPGEVSDDKGPRRHHARQLYEPIDVFRALKLPVIDWGTHHKWRPSSEEAKFLFKLGLLRQPPLSILVNLCTSPDSELRSTAFKYLVDNISVKYSDYDPMQFAEVPFIPALKDGQPVNGTPKEVFAHTPWATFGLLIVSPTLTQDVVAKLRIRQHPPSSVLISLLQKTPPNNPTTAAEWFAILAGQVSSFSASELNKISQLPIVPVKQTDKQGDSLRYLPLSQCFFGNRSKDTFHSQLFVFVDFGTAANSFLSACGTKQEPSVEEIIQMLLDHPGRFFELSGGAASFLNELRNIAANIQLISSGTITRMKRAPIFLGYQRTRNDKNRHASDTDEDQWAFQHDLKRADEIVIADDTTALQLFGHALFTAPQEDQLEALYTHFGSRRLSSLVKEDYTTSGEIHNHKAAEIHGLILERLPLFLHEHTHAKTKVSYTWLSDPAHFVVKSYGKISVIKTLTFGTIKLEQAQETSAVARRFGYGPIQLLIAANSHVDMYDVATGLNRLIFDSPKTNDALLFMTILSTDLKTLQRRGYNVDRILRQRKAKLEAAAAQSEAAAKAKAENAALMSKHESSAPPPIPPKPDENAMVGPPSQPEASDSKANKSLAGIMKTFRNFKQQIGVHQDDNTGMRLEQQVGGPHQDGDTGPRFEEQHQPRATRPSVPSSKGNKQDPTPLSSISSNIEMALKACRPEHGNLLRNTEEMQQVQEVLNEGYCDISGQVGDLKYIGAMNNMKIYVTDDLSGQRPADFLAQHKEPLQRFIPIMALLCQVYHLPFTTLHVFYDLAGSLIAFNRTGSIFFNLRYWEAWHDKEVAKGNKTSAIISWYFTLAHEIAHNLVQPHNSEHEFYFSAICEKHIMELAKHL